MAVHALANLGRCAPWRAWWRSERRLDVKPRPKGRRSEPTSERIELQPVDPQTNGPQLLYGLRYHAICQAGPGEDLPRPGQLLAVGGRHRHRMIHALTIPRGQRPRWPQARRRPMRKSFELVAQEGLQTWGICSAPFLQYAFRAVEVPHQGDGQRRRQLGLQEDTVLMIRGRAEPFHHRPQPAEEDRRADAEPAGALVSRAARAATSAASAAAVPAMPQAAASTARRRRHHGVGSAVLSSTGSLGAASPAAPCRERQRGTVSASSSQSCMASAEGAPVHQQKTPPPPAGPAPTVRSPGRGGCRPRRIAGTPPASPGRRRQKRSRMAAYSPVETGVAAEETRDGAAAR